MTTELPHRYPLTDLALARRLERTEALANAAFIEARARLEPEVGAAWIEVAGAYAMFDGPQSPITQTFGLGVFDDVGDAELARIEAFFAERGAPVHHEVCPMIPPGVLEQLNARGYQPIEFSSVLVRPTVLEGDGPSGASPGTVSARPIDASEVDRWARVAAAGWSSESPELADMIEGFGRIVGHARGAHCFLAWHEGTPIAAAGLVLGTDVALLAGASTIPDYRKLGAQRALLDARLRFAAERDIPLAMMVAAPGSGSQRNAERQGFRVAYTRAKWQLRGRVAADA